MYASNKGTFLFGRLLSAIARGASVAACAQPEKGSTVVSERRLGDNRKALLKSADVRLVTATTPGRNSLPGRVHPAQFTCIEPSPNIAKAAHEGFNFGGSLGLGGLPSGACIDLTLAFAKARTEAVAQMTERLATSAKLLRATVHGSASVYPHNQMEGTR